MKELLDLRHLVATLGEELPLDHHNLPEEILGEIALLEETNGEATLLEETNGETTLLEEINGDQDPDHQVALILGQLLDRAARARPILGDLRLMRDLEHQPDQTPGNLDLEARLLDHGIPMFDPVLLGHSLVLVLLLDLGTITLDPVLLDPSLVLLLDVGDQPEDREFNHLSILLLLLELTSMTL